MDIKTIVIIFGCLILFALYRIYRKVEDFYDEFESWYGDWQKKYDPYEPRNY